jgi:histidyl-tRNA synthetase
MVAICASFLRACGLKPDQVSILFNSRQLMEAELHALDIPGEKKTDVFRLIDRRDKLSASSWDAYAAEIGLNTKQLDGLKTLLASQNLWEKDAAAVEFFTALAALGVDEYVRYAPHIIRGLDYYTGIVFETWDRDGEFRAILGGGRYDNLVAAVGGEPLPATGFAMGDAVITLVLKKFGCIPQKLGASPAQVLVTIFDGGSIPASLEFTARLRQTGLNVACYPEAVKIGKQFRYAERMDLRVAAILGPEEQAKGAVALKDLRSGEQITVPQDQAAATIRRILNER